jgi:hypothetical protein
MMITVIKLRTSELKIHNCLFTFYSFICLNQLLYQQFKGLFGGTQGMGMDIGIN